MSFVCLVSFVAFFQKHGGSSNFVVVKPRGSRAEMDIVAGLHVLMEARLGLRRRPLVALLLSVLFFCLL